MTLIKSASNVIQPHTTLIKKAESEKPSGIQSSSGPDNKNLGEVIVKSAIAGAGSGVIGDFIAFPTSRIKTLQMVQGAAKASSSTDTGVKVQRSLYSGLKNIYESQGIHRGLYRGMSPVLALAAPANAFFFGTMEPWKQQNMFWGNRWEMVN